jgi:predicted acylesterase/phospholipase RssA
MRHTRRYPDDARMCAARNEDDEDGTHVVLCLQGGGARAAFQIGVYEALSGTHLEPDWVIGISSGALNAAVLAGNRTPAQRLAKLTELWKIWESPWRLASIGQQSKSLEKQSHELEAFLGLFGKPGFYWPRLDNPLFDPSARSFYQQTALARTMRRVIDFDYLNAHPPVAGAPRLSVGCSDVEHGTMRFFDNRHEILLDDDVPFLFSAGQVREKVVRRRRRRRADRAGRTTFSTRHLLAAAAYPPGAAHERIGRGHFWDGGVLDNSPLDAVFKEIKLRPRKDKVLVILVDLWSRESSLPRDALAATWRRLEMQHASRISSDVERFKVRVLRGKVAMMVEVLHVIYQTEEASPLDPLDFSADSIKQRRQRGHAETVEVLRDWQGKGRQAPWKVEPRTRCAVCVHHYARGTPLSRPAWAYTLREP